MFNRVWLPSVRGVVCLTAQSPAMLLQLGNAGSDIFADHLAVLTRRCGRSPPGCDEGC
jgi:hypothetical protein